MRVSSAMTVDGTLARACAKGNGPGSPITNHVVTLGPFCEIAKEGCFGVAAWEDRRGDADAARQIRAHAGSLTPDSWQIPTWLGHPSIGSDPETPHVPWGPVDAAIATRKEAEAVDERMLEGLPPWRYWLRESVSFPTGGEVTKDDDVPYEVCGDESRYASVMAGDRGYHDR